MFTLVLMAMQALACNPYMDTHSPSYDPSRAQMVFAQSSGGISRDEYFSVLEQVRSYYAPYVESRGGKLVMVDEWDNSSVNGTVRREEGEWRVFVYGGYARHRLATRDAVLFLTCHEAGHQFGGTPFYPGSYDWASAEGQADYFATLKCMRHLTRYDDNEKVVSELAVPQALRTHCESEWTSRADQLVCIRGAMAGYLMTQIWDNGTGTYKFDTPSKVKQNGTIYSHPDHQCRIDTYLQGALCSVSADIQVDLIDPLAGTCNASTGQRVGHRPACWYVGQ